MEDELTEWEMGQTVVTEESLKNYHVFLPHIRLQDLTDRDLEKQEREKTLNSLEAFIFETQV